MSAEKDVTVSEAESAVSAYEAAENEVKAAQENLDRVKEELEVKKTEAQQSLDALKARFESIGSAVTETVQEVASDVAEKVEEKLDAAKDEWAQLAMTDPDAARRQLRKFWILVAGGSGLVIGGLISALVAWIL